MKVRTEILTALPFDEEEDTTIIIGMLATMMAIMLA